MAPDLSRENFMFHLRNNTFTISEALDMQEIAADTYGFYCRWKYVETGNPVTIGRVRYNKKLHQKPNPIPDSFKPIHKSK